MSKQINIGGRFHSTEKGNVTTGANEVLDDTKGKKQNVINADVDAELLRLDQSKQNNLTFDNTPTENSNNPVKSSGVYAADKALSDAIEAIILLIPSAATALNQLADKSFVNSSIATDTATFRGTSETGLSEAQFLEWANSLTHDMNDYVFWQTIDEAGNTLFKRYKWNGTQWLYEYTLNNSSFTADQWAAITSGITTALVEKLVGLPTNAALQQALNSKQDALTFDNVPTEGSTNPVKSGGVYSAVKAEENARLNLAQTVSGIGGDVSQIEDVIPAGATAQNKLVANASMEAYVASIIQNITSSFTLATADGHINLTLTQTNGQVATLTLTSSDIASAQDVANLQQLYNNLQQSKPVPVTALPETGQQQGVIYRLAGTTSYSDYMWNGSTWVLMATYNNAVDPRPKKASQNLVTSGGVFDNMGALDVSELNATENPHTPAIYVNLSAAIADIPTEYQKGGMSIQFIKGTVHSSDNNYVPARLMANAFTTDVTKWQGIDDEPTLDSENLVKSGGVYAEVSRNVTSYLNRYAYLFNGQDLFVAYNNGKNEEITYWFRKCMANNLFTFYKVGYRTVNRNYPDTKGINTGEDITLINFSASDNIGPINMANGGVVGGNHTYSDGTNTYKTAKTLNYKVFVDGNILSGVSKGIAGVITVIVSNVIYDPAIAPNTGDEYLSTPLCAENIRYVINKNTIEVAVEHEYSDTTENTILNYFGMQSMFIDENYILTPNGQFTDWQAVTNNVHLSFTKENYPNFNRFIEKNSVNGTYQASYIVPDFRLGKHSCINSNIPIFIRDGSKDYHYLIDPYRGLLAGQVYQWIGSYTFMHSVIEDSANVFAYRGTVRGNDAVFINTKSAYNGNVVIPDDLQLKKLRIAECYGITTEEDATDFKVGGGGVYIKSTSPGSLILIFENDTNRFKTGEYLDETGIDGVPTDGSENIISSGSVFNSEKVIKRSQEVGDFDLFGIKADIVHNGYVYGDGNKFVNVNSDSNTYAVINVAESDIINFLGNSNIGGFCIFASDFRYPSVSDPNGYIANIGNRITYSGAMNLTAPENAKYFIFSTKYNNNTIDFQYFTINGISYYDTLRKAISDIKSETDTRFYKNKTADVLSDIHTNTILLLTKEIAYADLPSYEGRINTSNNKWYQLNSSNTHKVIEIKEGDVVYFTGRGCFCFLSSYEPPVYNQSVTLLSYSTSYGSFVLVPSGAKYMVWDVLNNGNNFEPDILKVNGIEYSSVVVPKHLLNSFDRDNLTDISDEAFIKQTVCLHHDSFYRTTTRNPWEIGSNFTATNSPEVNIPYVHMNSANDITKDDGFRIIDNHLVNYRDASTAYGIRVIPSARYVNEELLIEMSYPSLDKRCAIAFNIIDGKNYEAITWIHTSDKLVIQYRKFVDNDPTTKVLSEVLITGNSVKLQSNGSSIRLWIDNFIINDFAGNEDRIKDINSIHVDFSRPIGIHIQKTYDYDLKFINVFDLRQKYVVDVNRQVEANNPNNGIMVLQGTGNYSLSTDIKFLSSSSQRFKLTKDEVTTDPVTARIEYANLRKRSNNLRRYRVSFDIYLPDSENEYYNDDEVTEILFQMHDVYQHTDDTNRETVPPIALYTKLVNGVESFCFDILGTEKGGIINPATDLVSSTVEPMAEAVRGYWHHFDIYVKEGYIPEHNPLTIVKMDGQEVVRCTGVNAYNRAIGTYARYGFYKASWEYENIREACSYDSKVVYIDNFKLEI